MIAPISVADDDPDATLMERVRDGESELFGELALRYQSRVAALIKTMRPHGGDVDDLTQRVFVQAFRARSNYQPTAKFATWLYVIARNIVLNERRTLARRRETWLGFHASVAVAPRDSMKTPLEEAIRTETRDEVERALNMLSHRQRLVLQLVFMKGYRYRAAGEELNVSEKAVKSLVHCAKGNLKTHLRGRLVATD